MLVPSLSNLDYGIAGAVDWLPSPAHALEGRFSATPAVQRDLYQAAIAHSWFPFERGSHRRFDISRAF